MIDISLEQERTLSTSEIYSILSFSIQAAEEQGFISSFIFERALYLFAAVCIFKERKELSGMISNDILKAWDTLVEDGTIELLNKDYFCDMNLLADYGKNWYEEYTNYAHSARGLLSTIQDFSADIVKQASEQLKNMVSNENVAKVTEIAEKWGANPVK